MDLISFTSAILDTTGTIEPRALAVLAAGIAIGLGSCGASLAIGIAASRAFDAGARQPEVFGKIQTLLLICIAFIESLAIYALVVSLLLIFTVK
ncbi:MAG: ATP synthase F0 subunit C [Clostridiales bacterium]|jgi:F-type H+-transporting ATPase subunit c|nr:ATP synthase F0 subunit C [Clostridiales bacterium]